MRRPLVLDSSALLAVFFKEIGAAVVLDGMRDAGSENYGVLQKFVNAS